MLMLFIYDHFHPSCILKEYLTTTWLVTWKSSQVLVTWLHKKFLTWVVLAVYCPLVHWLATWLEIRKTDLLLDLNWKKNLLGHSSGIRPNVFFPRQLELASIWQKITPWSVVLSLSVLMPDHFNSQACKHKIFRSDMNWYDYPPGNSTQLSATGEDYPPSMGHFHYGMSEDVPPPYSAGAMPRKCSIVIFSNLPWARVMKVDVLIAMTNPCSINI